MKRNSKRRHPFILTYLEKDDNEEQQEYFVGLLQSPKVPERYAYLWVLKKVRNWFRESNIPFEEWNKYMIYPINSFNCNQFGCDDIFYEHIHVADYSKEDDKSGIDWYNNIKSRYACKIK